MNRLMKIFFPLLLCAVVSTAFAGGKKKAVYVFGVSASFTDSVVYFTPVQELDSVALKNTFLPGWDMYSYQLKHYLEQRKGLSDRTCMVYYAENKKKLLKQASKLRAKYGKNKSLALKEIDPSEFKFLWEETEEE